MFSVGQFSGLETLLITLLVAVISCLGTFCSMGRRYMTRKECDLKQDSRLTSDLVLGGKVDKLLRSQNLQFAMLREIVIYLDIPKDVQTKILNMKVETQ